MPLRPSPDSLRSVRVEQLIVVRRVIGEGVDEDPVRLITEVFEFDGRLVARADPIPFLLPPAPEPGEVVKG